MDTVGDVERRFTSIFVSLEVPDVLALFVCLLMKPLTLSIEAPALFKDAVMVAWARSGRRPTLPVTESSIYLCRRQSQVSRSTPHASVLQVRILREWMFGCAGVQVSEGDKQCIVIRLTSDKKRWNL